MWVVTRHQYRISGLVSQTSLGGKTSGSIAKCGLFSQATALPTPAYPADTSLLRTVCLSLRKALLFFLNSTLLIRTPVNADTFYGAIASVLTEFDCSRILLMCTHLHN